MFEIGLGNYLTLSAIIFTIGIVGIFLNRKNIIVILMNIELILLAVNINLVSFSIFLIRSAGDLYFPPFSPSIPTKSVSQKLHIAFERSFSSPDHKLHPEKRQNTASFPV